MRAKDCGEQVRERRLPGGNVDEHTLFFKCKFEGICLVNHVDASAETLLPDVVCKNGFDGIMCGVCIIRRPFQASSVLKQT